MFRESAAQGGQGGGNKGDDGRVRQEVDCGRDGGLQVAIGGRPQVRGVVAPGPPKHALLRVVQQQRVVHRTVA